MSIYDAPNEYAKRTFMSLEDAEARCKHFKNLQNEMQQATLCPKCGEHALMIEDGCYEEGTSSYVFCTGYIVSSHLDGEGSEEYHECTFTSEVTEQFEPVNHWYDFDEVLAFSLEIERKGLKKTETMIGIPWDEFVGRANRSL